MPRTTRTPATEERGGSCAPASATSREEPDTRPVEGPERPDLSQAPLTAPASLPELYARHRAGLRRLLARMIGDADAEDVLQDVFERAQAAPGDTQRSAGWLYRIARNAALDVLRGRAVREREAVRGSLRDAPPCDTPDQDLARTRTRSCVLGLVERLPPAQREVVRLTELRGLSDREAAEALGITLGSAKIRLHRARRALRELMECECRTYRDPRNELACEPVRPSTLRGRAYLPAGPGR